MQIPIPSVRHFSNVIICNYFHWQIGREQRKLLEAQRLMLHDAIQAQLAGQANALNRAVEPGFVRGYLAEHGDDDAYSAVYGADDAPA